MGRYDGEYYDYPNPCAEGSHTHQMNGTCHKCGILTTHDGLSLGEAQRRQYRDDNERLRGLLQAVHDKYYNGRSSLWRDVRRALRVE